MDYKPMLSPAEIVAANIKVQENRVKIPFLRLVVLSIMAGMFIAGGAAASSVAMHAITNVGVARTVGGCIFPVGLMLIVFIGGELFTGDCLLVFGVFKKKIKILQVIRVLVIVWIGNLIGAVIVAAIVYFSGQFDYSSGLLGAYTIKVALGKTSTSFLKAFCSGILCNVFVCLAVLMGVASKDAAGKILGIFFPILAFVVSGYEHCVANMYYIPAGLFALCNSSYKEAAMSQYGYTADQLSKLNISSFLINSSIPVTLGNMVGGMLFVAALMFIVNRDKLDD